MVAAPFEVRAHGVGFCEIIFLLGFCGALEFVWGGFVSSFVRLCDFPGVLKDRRLGDGVSGWFVLKLFVR